MYNGDNMSGLPPSPEEPPKVTESYNTQKRIPKRVIIIALTVGIVVLLGVLAFQFLQKNSNLPFSQVNPTPPAPGVIAKVGDELIYQRDLDIELAAYPPILSLEERKKILIEKIATDSAILQGARADGIISNLDPAIFNSATKDYLARLKAVSEIKQKVEGEADQIKGVIASIWFFNLGKTGPMGYDRGKEFALEKITKLHADVKSGKTTVEQAGELIRNDTSLAQIDASYKSNAIYEFDVKNNDKITSNPDFDSALKKSPVGQVTDVFLSIEDPYFVRPGLYQFGVVKNKVNSNIGSLEDWILKQIEKYEEIIY